jgi:hypothetical protein
LAPGRHRPSSPPGASNGAATRPSACRRAPRSARRCGISPQALRKVVLSLLTASGVVMVVSALRGGL